MFFVLANQAGAADAKLKLVLAGEAYDGLPSYQVLADETVIASGELTAAVDTQTMLLTDDSILDHSEVVELSVPEGTEVIKVEFLNDAWGGAGTTLDRNLYIVSAEFQGQQVMLSSILLLHGGEAAAPSALIFNSVPLLQTGDQAIFPLNALQLASPQEQVDSSDDQVAESKRCAGYEPLVLAGFAINSAELPKEGKERLTALAKSVPTGCAVTVTGFASSSGPAKWNKVLAGMRAEAAQKVLQQVLQPQQVTVAPGGIGGEPGGDAPNRSVSIVIGPAD